MKHSCIILNEKALISKCPPVSLLNPVFVCWQSISHCTKSRISEPLTECNIVVATNNELQMKFRESVQDEELVIRSYPVQALTGNYESYEEEMKVSESDAVVHIALAIQGLLGQSETWVNEKYMTEELVPLLEESSRLGWLSGMVYPDKTFGYDVFDACGVKYPYLTKIGHQFRKSKGNKFMKLINIQSDKDSICLRNESEEIPSMICLYAKEEVFLEYKVHQMSSARMHSELVNARKKIDVDNRK